MTARRLSPNSRREPAGGVFGALNEAGIGCLVWKDVTDTDAFDDGDAELDLLVARGERAAFRDTLVRHGYARYRNWHDLFDGELEHFIRFDAGRYFHLHVHYALYTGDHVTKEFDLGPLFPDGLPPRVTRNAVPVVAPGPELLIGAVRLIAKSARPGQIRSREVERLRSIYTPAKFDRAWRCLRRRTRVSDTTRLALAAFLSGQEADPRCLRRAYAELAALRRMGPARQAWLGFSHRCSAFGLRLLRRNNKRLAGNAPAIAIIGVDGTGKSTAARRLDAMLGAKISTRRVYLGGNRRTYRLGTRLVSALCLAAAGLRRITPGWPRAQGLYWALQALFEYAKALDRLARIRRADRLRRKGIVIIFERYPIRRLFDYPNFFEAYSAGRLPVGPRSGTLVRGVLSRIDRLLERAGEPAVTFLLVAPLETLCARRRPQRVEREDIERKLARLANFERDSSAHNLVVVRSEENPEAVVTAMCADVNRSLCSSSS